MSIIHTPHGVLQWPQNIPVDPGVLSIQPLLSPQNDWPLKVYRCYRCLCVLHGWSENLTVQVLPPLWSTYWNHYESCIIFFFPSGGCSSCPTTSCKCSPKPPLLPVSPCVCMCSPGTKMQYSWQKAASLQDHVST